MASNHIANILMRHVGEAGPERPGDFYWKDKGWKEGAEESGKIVVAIPPREGVKAKYELHWAPCSNNGGSTSQDRWWDGNWESPTIKGSWGIKHFHCWVNKGFLTLESPS